MFKISVEPNRLKSMLSQALKLKGGASSVDSVLLTFSQEGAKVRTRLAADVLVFANYNKSFFKTLEVGGNGEFMANTELVKKRLAYGYSGETIHMQTDEEKVTITGEASDDIVTQKLDAINHDNDAPFEVRKTDMGLIPENDGKLMTFAFSVLVPVEKFTDALPYEEALLTTDEEGKMSLNFKDELGERSRPILYKTPRGKVEPTRILFNFKTFQDLISMFTGEVWLSGDQKKIVISQTNSDFSLTYTFAPKKEY